MPRFRMLVPLDVTVLRSGIPDTLPGRALNVCERGMGAILAGELVTGESVGVELQLYATGDPLRTRATVRYHDKLQHGLEFTAISNAQRNAIRDWAKGVKAEPETGTRSSYARPNQQAGTERGRQVFSPGYGGGGPRDSKPKRLWSGWLFLGLLTLAAAGSLVAVESLMGRAGSRADGYTGQLRWKNRKPKFRQKSCRSCWFIG